MLTYLSVEPVVGGSRGLSELEDSGLDGTAGKAMWTADRFEAEPRPRPPWQPAAGVEVGAGRAKALTFFLFVESFRNGARPVIKVTLRQDRPREVSLEVFAARRSAPMQACVLSATMGNYARLRRLWLKGEVVRAGRLWPRFTPDAWGFSTWRQWPQEKLLAVGGEVVVAATGDEADPARARYTPDVPAHWRYQGKPATQYWRAPAQKGLVVRVNGRKTFWGTRAAIPGGVSFENVELLAPFRSGQEFRFGVSLDPPEKLGFDAGWLKKRGP
jgi:hypothetical protein